MSEKNFIDYIKIYCKSGNGGNGSIHFRREKFTPKGGPDGGDGGKGGSIIFHGNSQYYTLLHLKHQKHYIAGYGTDGKKGRSTGINGKNLIIEVPIGTVVKSKEGKIFFEITKDKQEEILFKGGKGGKGNWHFKNSVHQTPRYAELGVHGIEDWIILELKMLSHIGIIGPPNSGKSTLLSVLTNAKPKIDNYPFTTLVPNLGIIFYEKFKSFIIADIPGIIQGASQGKGLGYQFLRHIERNNILLIIIPVDVKDIKKEYDILLHELYKYNPCLLEKKRLLAISKIDLLNFFSQEKLKKKLKLKDPYIFISSFTKQGLKKIKIELWKIIHFLKF